MSVLSAAAHSHAARIRSEWLPVLVGLLVLYVPTFYDLATSLWQQDDYVHGPILLCVVLWLVWQERAALFTSPQGTAPIAGSVGLAFGLILYTLGRSQSINIFEVGSTIPVLIGVLLIARGWAGIRAMWFPILFIVFVIPLPGIFVDAVTGPLKHNVSIVAEKLLYTAGYPIARTGVALTVGQYQLLIADACSGLNSMFSLSALGLLYLYLMQYKSWLHNGLLLASILPIAFCANIVRVILLVLVTYHLGDSAGQGAAHSFAGMALFIIALLMLFAFDSVIRTTSKLFRNYRIRAA